MLVINLCLQKKFTVGFILCMNSHEGKGVGFQFLYQTPDI